MAIIAETGSIVAGAETYVDVATADLYHSNNGNTAWAASTIPAKEAALRKSARYIDGHYRSRWLGFRVRPVGSSDLPAQTMEWPRLYVEVFGAAPGIAPGHFYANYLPSNAIPQRVKDAQCELALRALSSDLAADYAGVVMKQKVDVIETEYAPGTRSGVKTYQLIDQLLSDYLVPTGNSSVQRA